MTSDTSEIYDAMRARSQAKRASNREQSAAHLDKHGVVYTVHNDGAHLIVEGAEGFIDFWPGTGRWKCRKSGTTGFGVRNLVRHIDGG